ncbi:hypothetical protein CS0771_53500 [Catellatospora sp. IY07-71]|uniref:hypothetical protein n=1 Tax=Catellatospora sp. IY07-71 TaxID=2728827 RepID=UPI001BB40236|nr:hypothetical protein [Catellatospora sp. IY07-71]BCJ75806.1 hypothetical protein CS0771_53500 [Catellatospora sp. IY07-71]
MTADETTREQVLRDAARTALAAPSIFNTQPWRWQADPDRLRLYADRQRQLPGADPHGRLLTISCGVALHHARTALAATGHEAQVRRLPDPADPDLLAELTVVGPHEPSLDELMACDAIRRRRTDRPFTSQAVTEAECRTLVMAGEREHAHVHLVAVGQVPVLALTAVRAGALQLSDPGYRAGPADWTHRPPWSGEDVPTATTVRASGASCGITAAMSMGARGVVYTPVIVGRSAARRRPRPLSEVLHHAAVHELEDDLTQAVQEVLYRMGDRLEVRIQRRSDRAVHGAAPVGDVQRPYARRPDDQAMGVVGVR